jgi:folate-dependent phosphoribosylglycinamide formyltransferase PurN
MKIVIFTQNTMASAVATRKILEQNHQHIVAVAIASQLKGSFINQLKTARALIKKSSFCFFGYKIIESKLYNILLKLKRKPSIRSIAKRYNIPIIETDDLSGQDFLDKINGLNPDYIFCLVAQILKKNVFDTIGKKLINAHGSYLPKYRGAAQYFWYLLNDDQQFGVTIHYMDAGLDTGDILFQRHFDYDKNSSAYKIHYLLAQAWGDMFNEFISNPNHKPQPQDHTKATITRMPTKEDIKQFRKKGKKLIKMKDFWECI